MGFSVENTLSSIPVSGGNARRLGTFELNYFRFRGADWSKSGQIVFAQEDQPLRIISETGGEVTELVGVRDGVVYAFPQFLPDGRHILYMVQGEAYLSRVAIVNADTGDPKLLVIEDCYFARYSPSGHLLYVVANEVFVVAFDLQTLEIVGTPKRVLEGVMVGERGRAQFDVAEDGTLVYLEGTARIGEKNELMWLDRDEQPELFNTRKGNWDGFALAPNEKRVAVEVENNIWILNKDGRLGPLEMRESQISEPLWSLDSNWIYYYSHRDGKHGIWRKEADISSGRELVFESETGPIVPSSISSNYLMMSKIGPNGSSDIWWLRLNGSNPEPKPLMEEPYSEHSPAISPNGKWLAYVVEHDQTELGQIYLRAVENGSTPLLVSDGYGLNPRWSWNGDQIFYEASQTIYSVAVREQGDQLELDPPQLIFGHGDFPLLGNWTVSFKSDRFLGLSTIDEERQSSPNHLKVISNWFTELNQLVPPVSAH